MSGTWGAVGVGRGSRVTFSQPWRLLEPGKIWRVSWECWAASGAQPHMHRSSLGGATFGVAFPAWL